jgi:hypothetical protein
MPGRKVRRRKGGRRGKEKEKRASTLCTHRPTKEKESHRRKRNQFNSRPLLSKVRSANASGYLQTPSSTHAPTPSRSPGGGSSRREVLHSPHSTHHRPRKQRTRHSRRRHGASGSDRRIVPGGGWGFARGGNRYHGSLPRAKPHQFTPPSQHQPSRKTARGVVEEKETLPTW